MKGLSMGVNPKNRHGNIIFFLIFDSATWSLVTHDMGIKIATCDLKYF